MFSTARLSSTLILWLWPRVLAAPLFLTGGELCDGALDAALSSLRPLRFFDGPGVLLLVRVAQFVPHGLRVFVGLDGAREVGGRGAGAPPCVAPPADSDWGRRLRAR